MSPSNPVRFTGNEDVPELRDLLLGRPGTAPDWDRAEKAARALTGALAHTPAGHRAGILTALGWLAWLQGRGTAARAWIARARDDEPRHRLALLLEQLIRREVAPVALDPAAAYRSDRA